MALPVVIPNTFQNASVSIPLSQLDNNFSTVAVAINGIANGVESLANVNITGGVIGNVNLSNISISSGNVTFTNANVTTLDATNVEVTNIKAKDGTAAATIADSTGIITVASSVLTTTDINGGTIDGTAIGGSSAASGAFTTMSASGVATFSAGTVSAPAITTTGDTNTGIYFPAADTIAFTEGGVESMRITSAGLVGIGTSSPYKTLHVMAGTSGAASATSLANLIVEHSTNTGLNVLTPNTAKGYITFGDPENGSVGRVEYDHTSNYLALWANASERMRLDASGNLGLGVTPSAWAAGNFISAQIGRGAAITGRGGAGTEDQVYISANAYNDGSWKYIGTNFASDYYQDNGTHVWRTAASGTAGNAITFTQAMTLDASGNLGIGTTTPVSLLDVNGTSLFRNTQYGYQPAPTSLATNTTLSVAQLLTQIIVLTGSLTITMPTGTTLDSGLPANFPTNGSFDFTLIDTDAGACNLAGNTGVTLVGSGNMDVNSSASFRLRKTGTATYVVYRLA
jgi:hypothetical protein